MLHDAVVAAAIGSDAPIGVGVSHGGHRVSEAMLVTGSSGSVVESLDDEPALDVYLRRLEAPELAYHDRAAFTRFALTHPLGLSRRSGESVRFVADADLDTRSLVCVADVPQGGLAWFMQGDDESVLRATDEACAAALSEVGGRSRLLHVRRDRPDQGDGGLPQPDARRSRHDVTFVTSTDQAGWVNQQPIEFLASLSRGADEAANPARRGGGGGRGRRG